MSTSAMGPIRLADATAAELAAADIQAAIPEAEITIDGATLMVGWDGDPQLSETIDELVRPYTDRPVILMPQ